MKEKISLFNKQKITYTKINDNLLAAKCYVMALGKNENKSHFSQESVEKAFYSLAYEPVVANLIKNSDGTYRIGGHDMKVDVVNGKVTVKSKCVPYGLVLPSEKPEFEIVKENGEDVKYLVANVLIWVGRYPEIKEAFYNEVIYCNQSMEINFSEVEKLEDDESYIDIKDFTFDALCMLGKSDNTDLNVEPCFLNAKIVPTTFHLDKTFEESFVEFKKELSKELEGLKLFSIKEKGGKYMDEKLELLKKHNLTINDLDFSIDDYSMEELTSKIENYTKKEEKLSFTLSYKEKREALQNSLDGVCERDEEGVLVLEKWYYLNDFSDTYVIVEENVFEKGKNNQTNHYKQEYEYNDITKEVKYVGDKIPVSLSWITDEEKQIIDEQRNEFEEYKLTHSHTNEEYDALASFKKIKDEEAMESLINKYKDELSNKDEFATLLNEKEKYSLEEFEKECIYIRGLYSSNKKQKLSFSNKFPIDDIPEDDSGYDYLYEKYLAKHI